MNEDQPRTYAEARRELAVRDMRMLRYREEHGGELETHPAHGLDRPAAVQFKE